jgi:hypothetical protein
MRKAFSKINLKQPIFAVVWLYGGGMTGICRILLLSAKKKKQQLEIDFTSSHFTNEVWLPRVVNVPPNAPVTVGAT